MIGTRTLARTLLAGIFLFGGANALRKSRQHAAVAEPVTDSVTEAAGVDASAERLVQVNAGVQLGAGVALILGIVPRLAALALGITLVPTTLAGHRFWEAESDEEKQQETIGFLKNAAILGGLIFTALDTGGRPSIFWSGRHAAATAADAVSDSAQRAYGTVAG